MKIPKVFLVLSGLWIVGQLIACAGSSDSPISEACTVSGDSTGPTQGIINGKTLQSSSRLAKGVAFLATTPPGEDKDRIEMCTASLIAPDLLLTAAHCVRTDLTSDFEKGQASTVYFSTDPKCSVSSQGDTSVIREVSKVVVHPGFKGSIEGGNDLALVFLKGFAPQGTVPLRISLSEKESLRSDRVFIAGYGRQTDVSEVDRGDMKLRFAELRKANAGRGELESKFLTLHNDEGPAACKGDSGGPALEIRKGSLVIVGVASFIFDPNNPNSTTCLAQVAYTKTSAFSEWIANNSEGRLGRN